MIGDMPRPPFRGLPWGPADRTGGVLAVVLDEPRVRVPVVMERHDPFNPTEDDNLYFIGDSTAYELVLITCGENGGGPLDLEDEERVRLDTEDFADAVAFI